jgi:hypothetical protein
MNIITGEKMQQLCDIYIGYSDDFNFNPLISSQIDKHLIINNINTHFNNPYFIFCYSHRIDELSTKIQFFNNDFILFTHNSDFDVRNTPYVKHILNCPKLKKWYSQNLCFEHEKINLIPIGIANSQWAHGNLPFFKNIILEDYFKTKNVYFNFNINTNRNKRQPAYNSLNNKLEWLRTIEPDENLLRLRDYKFCICPDGNGIDTHRLWEALYLKTVPIMLQSVFTKILNNYNVPIVILNSWDDFDESKLNYQEYVHKFDDAIFKKLIDLNNY